MRTTLAAAAHARIADTDPRAVVLVEGASDRAAVHAVATLRGIDLAARHTHVLAIGGSKNITGFLEFYGPHGLDLRVSGLYDAAERTDFSRGAARAGLTPHAEALPDSAGLAGLGFHACEPDLEGELIVALGTEAVLAELEAYGDLDSFRLMRRQPAQRGRRTEDQLHRFLGTRGGRKIEYAARLAAALRPDAVPRPLDALLSPLA